MTADQLAAQIDRETEWSPAVAIKHDRIIAAVTRTITALAETHPTALSKAIAIAVQSGPGNTCLVIVDPAAQDIADELHRLAQQGAPSPLAALMAIKVTL